MTDIRQVLATNMKKYRKMQGISQAKLADKINSATSYIAMIEIGRKYPSPGMLERIAQALNVDTPDLFTTRNITYTTQGNVSVERLFQDLLGDFQQFEKTVAGRLENWQQN